MGLLGSMLIWFALTAEGHKEETEMAIRNEIEGILVKWECGSTPLDKLLTVKHDGSGLVVGVGHDITPSDGYELGDRITIDKMNYFLHHDMSSAISGSYDLVGSYYKLPKNVRVVLACMCFQLGKRGVSKFVKMLAAIESGDYYTAANEMLDSEWAKQTKRRAKAMAKLMTEVE